MLEEQLWGRGIAIPPIVGWRMVLSCWSIMRRTRITGMSQVYTRMTMFSLPQNHTVMDVIVVIAL